MVCKLLSFKSKGAKNFEERVVCCRVDTPAMRDIHSIFNLQAWAAGKAVKIGRGPATVIG
jgi:hypothetical protein